MSFDRIALIRASNALSGIDFIQVSNNQNTLNVFFHHEQLPNPVRVALLALNTDQIHIEPLDRQELNKVSVASIHNALVVIDGRDTLQLSVNQAAGFGRYRLSIDTPVLDTYYNGLSFSFKANCPTRLDCETLPEHCPTELGKDFPIDYRARDFHSFRQALMDFSAQAYPNWQDRLDADVGMLNIELLAALGDEFSYAQDRIIRESKLNTASQKRSLQHLTKLVDYPIDHGQGANTWMDITANAAGNLLGGTVVCDALQQLFFELGHGLRDVGLPLQISPARNAFMPYIWDENDTCLKTSSIQMTLQGHHAVQFMPDANIDPKGKWVLLATQPDSPEQPVRRLMVRVISAFNEQDPLNLQAITTITWDTPIPFALNLETLTVRGNLIPATSGKTQEIRFRIGPANNPLDPDATLPKAIERVGIGSSLSYQNDSGRVKCLFPLPNSDKSSLVWFDVANLPGESIKPSRPEVQLLREGDGPWSWLPSTVGEETPSATAKVFTLEAGLFKRVVSFERMGEVTELIDYATSNGHTLRFGDGELGLAPPEGSVFTLRYRLFNSGTEHANSAVAYNIAADTLIRFSAGMPAFVDSITNPIQATGGRAPETLESIRTNAPQAYQALTHRAVRPEHFIDIAKRLDWVQQAGATFRDTGSWSTVFVTPDAKDESFLSDAHRSELDGLMNRVRQAGREVKVLEPVYANLDLEIRVCVSSSAYQGEVKKSVLMALFGDATQTLTSFEQQHNKGFFDPDHFTFGTPLSRAALMAAIQNVPGVKAVEAMRVRRRGWFNWRPFTEMNLAFGMQEIIRIGNIASQPEQGAVQLVMEGGA